MKKLLLIIACSLNFVNAQTTPETGEYISIDKSSAGINLLLNNDKTFQLFVFNGTYEFVNDSIIFNESLESKQKNAFNVKYSKNKSTSKKLKFTVNPNFMMGLNSEFLGVQYKENGDITYKSMYDYLKENKDNEELRSSYLDNDEDFTISFELDKPYAVYLVAGNKIETKIEKYLIQSDVTEITIANNSSLFDNLKLAGNINNDKSVNVFIERKPMKFINKKKLAEIVYEKPASKTIEKNWTYPGKKNQYNYDDSTAVVVDSAVASVDYGDENRYEFKAKVENSLKEALVNLKKEPAKYLFVYYNPKGKKVEKEFKNFIDEYNTNVGYNMYSEYDATYDKFNFYLATNSDESFFKKNNITDKSILILNKEGKIIASSVKSMDKIAYTLNYDSTYLTNKLQETENTIALSNSVSNKKTSIPELTKSLNTNYTDFFKANYYYNNHYAEVVETENNKTEVMAVEDTELIAVDTAAVAYENNDFKYYKSEVSEKILAEKLNTIFEYYNSKNIVNNDLVNILLGEITDNHTSFDLFKNSNNSNNKQEIKYINYILKYNENQKNKTKIAIVLNGLLTQKEANNPDFKVYNEIANSLISYSGNNFTILQSAIHNFNAKEQGSEEANKLVDLYYNTLVNDKPVFENIDAQFNNLSTETDYTTDWTGYKNQINSMLNQQAWNVFEANKTKDFERAIKWSELSNIVEKENAYSLDTLGQLYFAVGRKSEAIVIQTKAVAIAKAMGISHEEFEKALNNMKK